MGEIDDLLLFADREVQKAEADAKRVTQRLINAKRQVTELQRRAESLHHRSEPCPRCGKVIPNPANRRLHVGAAKCRLGASS